MRLKSTKHRWRFKTEYLEDRVEQPAFSSFMICKSLMMASNLKRVTIVLKYFNTFYTQHSWKVAFYCVISCIFVTCSLISYAIFFCREHISIVTTDPCNKIFPLYLFYFNRVWSLNKWPTRFICQARSMDTTLRLKAMEKESLTSTFLLNRCNLSLILVQYMLVSVQYMREAFSQPTLFHFFPWYVRGCFWRRRKWKYDRTRELGSVFRALQKRLCVIFQWHWFKVTKI